MTPLSKARLYTCHPLLITLFEAVDKVYPTAILEGHRGKMAQDQAFATGKSKLKWPDGEHNKIPSRAVDAGPRANPYDEKLCRDFAATVIKIARAKNIKIRWGGNWDGDDDITDQTFNDLVHYELK